MGQDIPYGTMMAFLAWLYSQLVGWFPSGSMRSRAVNMILPGIGTLAIALLTREIAGACAIIFAGCVLKELIDLEMEIPSMVVDRTWLERVRRDTIEDMVFRGIGILFAVLAMKIWIWIGG